MHELINARHVPVELGASTSLLSIELLPLYKSLKRNRSSMTKRISRLSVRKHLSALALTSNRAVRIACWLGRIASWWFCTQSTSRRATLIQSVVAAPSCLAMGSLYAAAALADVILKLVSGEELRPLLQPLHSTLAATAGQAAIAWPRAGCWLAARPARPLSRSLLGAGACLR